ncbi:MAG: efflux transporter outer membrane subunit [Verrucomicrobia bacterium]|nr:efflux transporter outer membrane subunit [Verrucomicrobiota bacterium]
MASRGQPGWRILLLLVGVLTLAGCAVGPNYQRPTVAVPTDWRWQPAEPRDHVPRGAWWAVFEDPTLEELQAAALRGNLDLQAAFHRVDQARALARVSRAEFWPTLNAAGDWTKYRTSGNSPSPVPFPVPSFTQEQWRVGLDLSYEVDLWGRVRRSFESARYLAMSADAAYQAVLLTMQADVAATYFSLRGTDQQLEVLRETMAVRTNAFAAIEQRVRAGFGTEFEVQRARVEVASAQAVLHAAERRRAELANALAVLCGQAPADFEAPVRATVPPLPPVAPDLPSTLLERRPDVARAERELAARNAEIGVAKAAFFPVVRLTAAGGYLSGEAADLFLWDSRTWGLNPSVSWPVFAGAQSGQARGGAGGVRRGGGAVSAAGAGGVPGGGRQPRGPAVPGPGTIRAGGSRDGGATLGRHLLRALSRGLDQLYRGGRFRDGAAAGGAEPGALGHRTAPGPGAAAQGAGRWLGGVRTHRGGGGGRCPFAIVIDEMPMKSCCSCQTRTWMPAASGGLLVLAALLSNGCQPGGGGGPPADPTMEVVIAQPARQPVEDTLSAVGTVEANERVTIQPEVPGLIEEIRFAEGQRVEQGQTLFRMESRTEAAAVLQAQAELRLARSNLERARTLVGSLAVSAQELDQLESLLDVKTALLKTEEERLAKRTLTAPFSGIVGPRLVSAGQYVGAGTPLVTLVDDAQVKVSCRLPERQSALVRLGQPARLRVAAWPDTTFSGHVDLLDAVVDPATRTLAVRVLASNPDFRLKAGMFARVELVVQSRPESLVIPGGGARAFVGAVLGVPGPGGTSAPAARPAWRAAARPGGGARWVDRRYPDRGERRAEAGRWCEGHERAARGGGSHLAGEPTAAGGDLELTRSFRACPCLNSASAGRSSRSC